MTARADRIPAPPELANDPDGLAAWEFLCMRGVIARAPSGEGYLLTCMCRGCGHSREFADLEAAFEAGWDAPTHFTGYVCCDLCPAVAVLGLLSPEVMAGHRAQHERWRAEGRPDKFEPPTPI